MPSMLDLGKVNFLVKSPPQTNYFFVKSPETNIAIGMKLIIFFVKSPQTNNFFVKSSEINY